ncbi:MAG: ABC transporter ATP-binding protein [Candidatus Bathyarchaeota archaeon]
MQEIVRFEDVWVEYDNIPILEEINLCVNLQDFIGIIGPNGGGKTTLLKVILGLIKPCRGKIKVLGANPENNRKYIGYVPQYSNFDREFPMSVEDAVLTGRLGQVGRFRRYSKEDKKIAYEALEKMEILNLKDRHIGELSGGQNQRVSIARALVTKPKLLLLDEPTASVDRPMEVELYELLQRLKKDMAIVLVTHDISAVSVYVDKIACLNQKLFYHGSKEISPEELSKTYKCPVQMIAHGFPHRVLKKHNTNNDVPK